MEQIDESKIVYLQKPVPEELTEAAWSTISDLGFDFNGEETYLAGDLLQVRWICDESTINVLGVEIDVDCEYPATMLRVDYEQWILPGDFNPELPDRVIYRREHIYVRASVLQDEGVVSYGLGPEYGFDHWEQDLCSEGTIDEVGLPADAITVFIEKVEEKFENKIEEYLEQSSIPQDLIKSLQTLYQKVLDSITAEAAADCRLEQVIQNELGGELIELDPKIKVNNLANGIRHLTIHSKSGHFRRYAHQTYQHVVVHCDRLGLAGIAF